MPRGRCGRCGKTLTVEPPWAGKAKGFTLMFEAMCLLLLRDMPVASLARFVGEQDTRLWRMLARHVDEARGYRSFRNLRTMLYFTGSHLKLPQYAPFNGK